MGAAGSPSSKKAAIDVQGVPASCDQRRRGTVVVVVVGKVTVLYQAWGHAAGSRAGRRTCLVERILLIQASVVVPACC